MTEVSYAVPAATTSSFLVITDRPPVAVAPGMATVTWSAEESPFDPAHLLDRCDGPLPPPSAFHTLIASRTAVRTLPRAAQVARAHARQVAVGGRGLLIDWLTREVVLCAERPERAQFCLADQWPLNDWLGGGRGFLRSLVGSPPDDFGAYAELQL